MTEGVPLLQSKTMRRNQVLAGAVGAMAIAMVGTQLGFSAIAIPTLMDPKSDIHVDEETASWIASIVSPSCMMGCLLTSIIAEKTGRKMCVLVSCIVFTISWLVIGLSPSAGYILGGRIIGGLAMALAGQVQVYICEICDPCIRGIMSTSTGFTVMLGIFYVYLLGSMMHWQTVAFLNITFPVCIFLAMLFMPESPNWLLTKGKEAKALESLKWLRGYTDVTEEMQKLKDNETRNSQYRQSWRLFLSRLTSPSVWKPFCISIALFFVQEFSGIYSVTFYQVNIFQMAGSTVNEYLATVVMGVVRIVTMLITCYLLIFLGRRHLFFISGAAIASSMCLVGTFFFLEGVGVPDRWGWVPMAGFLLFTIGLCLGYEPLPFLVTPELLPGDIRGRAMAICILAFEVFRFLTVKYFPYLIHTLQPYGTFWLYGTVALSGVGFVYYFLPETKGKRLEDIEALFIQEPPILSVPVENGRADAFVLVEQDKDKGQP